MSIFNHDAQNIDDEIAVATLEQTAESPPGRVSSPLNSEFSSEWLPRQVMDALFLLTLKI